MTEINLLPWRRIQRDLIKRKLKLYCFSGVATISLVFFLSHHSIAQVTERSLLHQSPAHTADLAVLKNRKKITEDNIIVAKFGGQSLDSLHYIGLIKDGSKTWGLISQSDGLVSIVLPGDYLGKEHGQVMYIKTTTIEIKKNVWSKQGMVKKWLKLPLREA